MKTKQVISLAFSPCPNDTFIFDAMIHHKIDTECLKFEYTLADVEKLNLQAIQSNYDVTKLSFFTYLFVSKNYQLLNAGSALGTNCGPLLISKNKIEFADLHSKSIVIPGKHTTANFLLSFAFPKIKNKREIIFSEIENEILSEKADAGVIIHESRFTYEQKGLVKIIDLGENWETKTGYPIPLGGIAIKRELSTEIKQTINRVLKRSVEFALQNPTSSKDFVAANAQEMDELVMQKHINLYVNDFSISLGATGKKAVSTMFNKAKELNFIESVPEDIFVHE